VTEKIHLSHEAVADFIVCRHPDTKMPEYTCAFGAKRVDFSRTGAPILKAGGSGGFYKPSVSTTPANSDSFLSNFEKPIG
jgi:hypothetical protein